MPIFLYFLRLLLSTSDSDVILSFDAVYDGYQVLKYFSDHKCDWILENHPCGRKLHSKYLVLKSSIQH